MPRSATAVGTSEIDLPEAGFPVPATKGRAKQRKGDPGRKDVKRFKLVASFIT